MILRQLFGESCDQFLATHYLAMPYAKAGGCRELLAGIGVEDLCRVFDGDVLDLVIGRGGQPWPDAERPTSAAAARHILEAGGTLCVRHAERHSAAVAGIADRFRRDLQAPVDVHLHWTPPTKQGFGWHYDAEEVFVLQVAGSKEWWLRKNTVNPWPLMESLPDDMRYEREIMPAMRCLLAPGDVLYVPNGYWHRTVAGETSLSLSIGVLAASAIDLLDFARKRLRESLRWRQRLPLCQDDTNEIADLKWRTILADLSRDISHVLSDPRVIRDFYADWATRGAPVDGTHVAALSDMTTHIQKSNSAETEETRDAEPLPQLVGDKPGESGATLPPQIEDGGEAVLSGQPRELTGDRSGTPADKELGVDPFAK